MLWISHISAVVSAADHYPDQTVVSPDGRSEYSLSDDGWVQKYDALSGKQLGRVRTGAAARNIAISVGGKWLAVVNTQAAVLTILSSADLSLATVIKSKKPDGTPSGLTMVYNNPLRESFIFTLTDAPKIWEVFYGPNPPEMGFAHDWRTEGPVPQTTPFPVRKITTADYLTDLVFDPSHEYVLAAARQGGGMVIDLVIGQKVADFDLTGQPHFSGGYGWKRSDTNVFAVPHANEISLIEMQTWEVVGNFATSGAAQSVQSHKNAKHLWVGVVMGQHEYAIDIVDKQTLKIVKTIGPIKVERLKITFNETGNRALIMSDGGDEVLITYNAHTLKKAASP